MVWEMGLTQSMSFEGVISDLEAGKVKLENAIHEGSSSPDGDASDAKDVTSLLTETDALIKDMTSTLNSKSGDGESKAAQDAELNVYADKADVLLKKVYEATKSKLSFAEQLLQGLVQKALEQVPEEYRGMIQIEAVRPNPNPNPNPNTHVG